jgi:hypothetical protein
MAARMSSGGGGDDGRGGGTSRPEADRDFLSGKGGRGMLFGGGGEGAQGGGGRFIAGGLDLSTTPQGGGSGQWMRREYGVLLC